MIYIKHRINRSAELHSISSNMGVEIDLRSYGGDLIVQHNPFTKGEYFSEWLEYYSHSSLILNVKEEDLEEKIIECLKKKNITN